MDSTITLTVSFKVFFSDNQNLNENKVVCYCTVHCGQFVYFEATIYAQWRFLRVWWLPSAYILVWWWSMHDFNPYHIIFISQPFNMTGLFVASYYRQYSTSSLQSKRTSIKKNTIAITTVYVIYYLLFNDHKQST